MPAVAFDGKARIVISMSILCISGGSEFVFDIGDDDDACHLCFYFPYCCCCCFMLFSLLCVCMYVCAHLSQCNARFFFSFS